MLAGHSNLVHVVVLITTLFCHQSISYEMPSHQTDSNSSPRDQFNYHHYRRSDQYEMYPQQRQIALNAIPSHSQKYQGWKPIISSRRLQTPGEKYSQYPSTTTVVSSSIINDANGKTDTTTELPSKAPIQQIKRKIIKEDDVMRMHYGANDDDEYQKAHLPSLSEAKPKNNANQLESRKQYHSQYKFDQMTMATRQNPKNIYEIMEGNSPPTFKPIAQSMPSSSSPDSQTKDTRRWYATDEKDFNSAAYNGIDNKISAEAEKETNDNISDLGDRKEQVVKIDPYHLPATADDKESRHRTQMDITSIRPIHVEPTKETSMENEYISPSSNFRSQNLSEKGGKFLGKPIVIAEQTDSFPYFTAEYYRRLFDSFGRQDRSFDDTKKFSEDVDSTANTTTNNRTDNKFENTLANCISDSTKCQTNSNQHENRTSHRPRHKHRFNIFKFMGVDMKDLMPKTLRFNIYLIKKLLEQCYTELQDEDPSSIVCLKKITTKVLDNAIEKDIIKLTDNVSLVKENVTAIAQVESSRSSSTSTDWLPNIVDKMGKLFSTHSLKVQLVNSQDDHKYQVEGRRRHYRRVFPIVVGAYMILSTVLIPLGFKFMTLLGTKSLLLSKLSLMISLMGGLKKLFGYGRRLHHYRRVFPVIVGAYMILYSILIPLSFKLLLLLGGKTLIISKLALFLSMVGSLKKYINNAESYHAHSHHHEPYYPSGPYYHRKAGTTKRKDNLILSKKIHHG